MRAAAFLSLSIPSAGLAQSTAPLIRIGAGPDDTSLPIVYAVQSGMLKKAGLNVELQKLAGGSAVSAAVAGGSLEIGKANAISVIQAHVRGLPFTVLGNVAVYKPETPTFALIVMADSAVKSAKDLPGKVLTAVSIQDMSTIAIYAWLEKQGVDYTTLKFAEMPASVTLNAMEAGRVTGSTIYEPMLTAALATGKVRAISYPYEALGTHNPGGLLIANTAWVAEHREIVERFVRVMHDASAYVETHETELIPMTAAYTGMDPAVLTNMHHEGRGGSIRAADLQQLIDISAKYKVIPKPFPASELICTCALPS